MAIGKVFHFWKSSGKRVLTNIGNPKDGGSSVEVFCLIILFCRTVLRYFIPTACENHFNN
jgi:hypothetical protein